jgi:hypothetical protein
MLTYLLADASELTISSHNEFRDGGVSIKALCPEGVSLIDDHGHMCGAQIVAAIPLAQDCRCLGQSSCRAARLALASYGTVT